MINAGLLNPDLSLPTRGPMVVPGLPADMQPVTLKPAGLGNINSIKSSCAEAMHRTPVGSRASWCRNNYLSDPGSWLGDCRATCRTYTNPGLQTCQACADNQCPKSQMPRGPSFMKPEAAQGMFQRMCMRQPNNDCHASCGKILQDAYDDAHSHNLIDQATSAVGGLRPSDLIEGVANIADLGFRFADNVSDNIKSQLKTMIDEAQALGHCSNAQECLRHIGRGFNAAYSLTPGQIVGTAIDPAGLLTTTVDSATGLNTHAPVEQMYQGQRGQVAGGPVFVVADHMDNITAIIDDPGLVNMLAESLQIGLDVSGDGAGHASSGESGHAYGFIMAHQDQVEDILGINFP